jgi:hypothetical protein
MLTAHCSLHHAKRTGSERKIAVIANTALEALRTQIPLFVLDPLLKVVLPLKWRERITRSALEVKLPFAMNRYPAHFVAARWGPTEIWEPKRGYVWMNRLQETHKLRKAAQAALRQAQSAVKIIPPRRYLQLAMGFENTS